VPYEFTTNSVFFTLLTCKIYTFVRTDPCFVNSIIMLNGSWIRVRLHVTSLTVDEQTGQSAVSNRGRSKYSFSSAFEMCYSGIHDSLNFDYRVHGSEVSCHWQHSSVAWPAGPLSSPSVEKPRYSLPEYLLLFVSKH